MMAFYKGMASSESIHPNYLELCLRIYPSSIEGRSKYDNDS